MQKWFSVTPELVEVGESVRKWDYDLDFYVELEVLKICPKTFLVMKYDKKKEKIPIRLYPTREVRDCSKGCEPLARHP